MISRKNRVRVLGGVYTKFQKNLPKSIREVTFEVFKEALKDAEIQKEDIDGLYVTPPGLAGPPSFMHACELIEYLGLPAKTLSMVECGGCTSAVAMRTAAEDILSGRIETACVIALDWRAADIPEDFEYFIKYGVLMQTCLYGVYDAPYGVGAPIPYYAMSAQRYMYEFNVPYEKIANVAVVLRKHAERNPLAEYRTPITVEDVKSSRELSPPFRLLDCSPFSSGAGCIIFGKDDGKKDGVYITGCGEFHHSSHFINSADSITRFISVRKAAQQAYELSGKKPQELDVAEIYGVFTATELMILEGLGLAEEGKAWVGFEDGSWTYGGKTVIDPSGGRLSLGHPAAVTPLAEMVEVYGHLSEKWVERNVKNAKTGLVHAEHGMLNGGIVFILERD